MDAFLSVVKSFVQSPYFLVVFIGAAALLIAGVIMRFGFKTIGAVGFSVYDMMVILFIFALSFFMKGVGNDSNDLTSQLFSSFINRWFTPLIDMFGVHDGAGLSFKLLLYEGGKLLILAVAIELFERLFDLLRKIWTGFWIWWLSEAAIAVIVVFLFTLGWSWLEQNYSDTLQTIIPYLFGGAVLLTVVIGVISLFSPTSSLLESELYSFLLTSVFISVLSVLLALIIAAGDLMPKMDAFFQQFGAASTESVAMTAILLVLLIGMWYILYRILRIKK